MKTVEAAPRAAALIEGMRDFGYSLDTALADIIDNSITAEATSIQIETEMFGDSPYIAVVDDGLGMSESELHDALRPGSRDPRETRHLSDLGRFGLGLKTASFSQCRRVTVVTRTGGKTSSARWDLDRVSESNQWLLEIPGKKDLPAVAGRLGSNGTVVIWEKLDRLHGDHPDDAARTGAVSAIDQAVKHLALVFHRFIKSESGLRTVEISVNGRVISGSDPFRASHSATIQSPLQEISFKGETIRIQAFTLPHHSKVSRDEWEQLGGPDGYLKSQGFYVYRSGRLIIHGTWFGLARQSELTKLCRVRIDLPNSLDSEWKIDVKKASAQPPRVIRDHLRNLISALGASSKRVYTHRGTRLTEANQIPVWQRAQKDGLITYVVNRDHPVVKLASESGEVKHIDAAIRVIETSLPFDSFLADLGDSPESVVAAAITDDALAEAVIEVVRHFAETNLSRDALVAIFQAAEPFRSNLDRSVEILDALDKELP